MQNKFFGSKLNTALLVFLIILMVFALRFMYQYKEGYLPSIQNQQAENEDNFSEELVAPVEEPVGKSPFDNTSIPEGIRKLVPKEFVIKKSEKTSFGLNENVIFIATIGIDPTPCLSSSGVSYSSLCQASIGDKIAIFVETPIGFNLVFPNRGTLTLDNLLYDGTERYSILHTKNSGNTILWVQSNSNAGTTEVAQIIYPLENDFSSEYITEKGLLTDYQFNGYNNFQIEKIKGKEYIVHSLAGYSKEASRCCPDLPSLKIYWSMESGRPEIFKTEKIPLISE